MPRRRNGSRKSGRAAVVEGGRSQPAFLFTLDQFVDLLGRESPEQRARWIRAHGREIVRRYLWNFYVG